MTIKRTLLQILIIGIACIFALSVNYLYAAVWQGPPAGTPPANNVDSPINVGTTNQVKDANLSVGHSANTASDFGLISYGKIRTTIGGVQFPDGTVQTTAAGASGSGNVDYSPTINGLTWQNITMVNSPISSYMGGYQCGPITTLTLSAGNGLTDASKGAIVSIYSYDNDEASQGYKVYDMSNALQGVFGRASRGGDGQGFGAGGELMVKLTARQFKLSLCRRSGAPPAVTYFATKGVIN